MKRNYRKMKVHFGMIQATDPCYSIFPVVMDHIYEFHMRNGMMLNTVQFTEPVFNYCRLTRLIKITPGDDGTISARIWGRWKLF